MVPHAGFGPDLHELGPPIYTNYIDSHSRVVDEGVTVGRCRMNCLLFADDLVLLASSEQGLQHPPDRFSVITVHDAPHLCVYEKDVLYCGCGL